MSQNQEIEILDALNRATTKDLAALRAIMPNDGGWQNLVDELKEEIAKPPPATAHAIVDPDTGDIIGYYVAGHIGFDAMARAIAFYDGTAIASPPPGSRFAWTYFRRVDVADPGDPPRWELREVRADARGAERVTVFEW